MRRADTRVRRGRPRERIVPKARKAGYYARSLAALGRVAASRRQLLRRLVRPAGVLALRDGTVLELASRLDLLLLKEVVCDDVYGLRSLDPGPRTIVDVGASIGDFAVTAARRHPEGRVLAFEPDPAAFARLAGNMGRNGVRNVALHEVALGALSLIHI